ncbi:hypothetical protein SAMN05519104_6696 [Rhizobiales bacterium GAS188]|nr:hypothetical protein SAMN05519104_6696 [Rhizobiales bacterium GAS188]
MSARPIVMSTISGRPTRLVDPVPDEVDFRDLADTLARIRRFGGAARKEVSVAQHSLIAADCAPDILRPWVLLHDAHEWRMTDIPTPVVKALSAIADEEFEKAGYESGYILRSAIKSMKWRHDCAIHAAARLPMPTPEQRVMIKRADFIALATERRDFCDRQHFRWEAEIEAATPLRRPQRLMSSEEAADRLYDEFRHWLPRFVELRRSA